jgi:hypothetical protein
VVIAAENVEPAVAGALATGQAGDRHWQRHAAASTACPTRFSSSLQGSFRAPMVQPQRIYHQLWSAWLVKPFNLAVPLNRFDVGDVQQLGADGKWRISPALTLFVCIFLLLPIRLEI